MVLVEVSILQPMADAVKLFNSPHKSLNKQAYYTRCKLWLGDPCHGALYLPNRQTTLVIALDALFLLFCIFINTTAYHLGKYEPSPPSTKELHALYMQLV